MGLLFAFYDFPHTVFINLHKEYQIMSLKTIKYLGVNLSNNVLRPIYLKLSNFTERHF